MVAESASDEMGFCSSSGIPELRIGITRSSISGKTSFFYQKNGTKILEYSFNTSCDIAVIKSACTLAIICNEDLIYDLH